MGINCVADKVKNKITHVPFIDLKRQYFQNKEQILNAIDTVLSSGNYILGDVVEAFEDKISEYVGCHYVLSVANGTDALILALKSLGIQSGDEVILPANSFIATAGAVAALGAIPILCDIQKDLNLDVTQLEKLITQKTKAIIPVHLTGRPAEMDTIMNIAKQYSLFVIEDAAQSIGAKYKNKMTGAIGDIGCFSLHPLKNLRVYGDGGLITTNDEKLYLEMKLLRNHGLINRDTCMRWGLNSRLDTVQAAVAMVNLSYLNKWNDRRRQMASIYHSYLKQVVETPCDNLNEYAVYHNYVIFSDKRDELMNYLLKKNIETKIHYPVPIHLQPAAKYLGYQLGDFPMTEMVTSYMLSLPIYSELSDDEQNYVIENILRFYGE